MAVELLCDRAEDPDAAAAGVATTALMETGLDELAGPHRTWLGVTARFLVELHGLALPPDRIVLHLDEILDPRDEAVRVALTRMTRGGYQTPGPGGVELVALLLSCGAAPSSGSTPPPPATASTRPSVRSSRSRANSSPAASATTTRSSAAARSA